jgi:hypothetical protein
LLTATQLQRNQVNPVFALGIVLKGSDHRCFLARVRNSFVPASRPQVFERIRHRVSPTMPFVNLPDTHKSRWGDELTAEKMKGCVWLRPEAVAQIEFRVDLARRKRAGLNRCDGEAGRIQCKQM